MLYVADVYSHHVVQWREGAEAGEVVAGGNGQGGRLDQLNSPLAIAVKRDGAVLVADSGNNRGKQLKFGCTYQNGESTRLAGVLVAL